MGLFGAAVSALGCFGAGQVWWRNSDWVLKRSLNYSVHLLRMYFSLLSRKPFRSLVDCTVLNLWKDVWWYRTWRWREVGDSSQSFSSDTSGDIVRMKWRYYRTGLYTEKKRTSPRQFHESVIGQHLLDNAECALHYNKDKFSVLARARTSFHLSALEATFIKSLNPLLCKKKNSFTPWRFPKPLELSIGWPVQRLDEVQITSLTNDNSPFLSPKPLLIGHCFNQWDLFFSVYKPVR